MKKFTALLLICFITGFTCIAQTRPRLNHIALSVHDLRKSTHFYQRIVGLDTIPEPFHDGRHTWFSIGNSSHLHLIQNEGPIVTPSKNTHLCFSVHSVKAFSELLKNAGMVFEDWAGTKGAITTRMDKVKQLYLEDPDGHRVEINDDVAK